MAPQLQQATSTEDIKGIRTVSAEEWQGDLTLDQYLQREKEMTAIVNSDGLLRTWMLQDDGQRVAACETLRVPAYFKDSKGSYTGTQNIFANVCTPQQFRGKGYAREMISSITKELHSEGPLTLWSDVGNYYGRVGFHFANSNSLVSVPSAESAKSVTSDTTVTTIDQKGAYALLDKHIQLVKDTVDALCKANGKSYFAILPTKGLYAQLFFRATFTAEKLGFKQPTSYGATTSTGWAVWSPSYVDNALYILGIDGSIEDQLALFKAGLEEARNYGLKLVVYEDSFADPAAFAAALTSAGIEFAIASRKKSLAMYSGDRHWACAGKYAWF